MKKALKILFRIIKSFARPVFKVVKYSFPPVLAVTELVKDFLNNPNLDILVALSKSEVDNKLLTKLRAIMRELDPSLKGVKGDEAIVKFAEKTRKQPKIVRDAYLMKIGSELTKEVVKRQTGKRVKSNEADLLFQLGYSQLRAK